MSPTTRRSWVSRPPAAPAGDTRYRVAKHESNPSCPDAETGAGAALRPSQRLPTHLINAPLRMTEKSFFSRWTKVLVADRAVNSLGEACAARSPRNMGRGVLQTSTVGTELPVSRGHFTPGCSRRVRSLTMLIVVLAVGAMAVSAVVPALGEPSAAPPDKLPATSAVDAVAGAAFPTAIRHVIVVVFENEPLSAIQADNGYLWSLTQSYAYASAFYSPCHPSEPNYLSIFSDSTQGKCGSDAMPPSGGIKASSMATVAPAGNLTWAQYAESMPAGCPLGDSPPFVVHHTPALYFAAVTSSKTTCEADVHSFSTPTSLAGMAGFPENYVFITPDNNHNKPISASDAFAKALVTQWSTESWWSSTVVFFVYDESADSDTKCPAGLDGISTTNCGGHVFLAAVSPYTAGEGAYTANADQYSLYQTAAWLLGLPQGATGTPMTAMFGAAAPTDYTVSGAVTYASNGTAVSGAQVTLTPGSSTVTGTAGRYSFSVVNGSYSLSVTKAGLLAQTMDVTVAGTNVVQGFSMEPFVYLWTGEVTNASSGAGIAGATVAVTGGPSATTNASGGYALDLANGTYSLTASAQGFQAANSALSVSGGGGTKDLSLLPSPMFTLSGTITSAFNGSAVSGAEVGLSTGASAQTSARGGYSLSVPIGTYTLTVTADGFHSQIDQVTVTDASVDQNVSLFPYLYWLNGTVLSPQNQPLVGVNVSVSATEWGTTNASGMYAFDLPNGTYSVTVHAPALPTTTIPVAIQGAPVIQNLTVAPSVRPNHSGGAGLVLSVGGGLAVGQAIAGGGIFFWIRSGRWGINWRHPRELAHSVTEWFRMHWPRR
jgi:phosphatidylinositol-3-phosphatase